MPNLVRTVYSRKAQGFAYFISMVALAILVIWAYFGSLWYQSKSTMELLDKQAPGSFVAANYRASAHEQLHELHLKVRETNSPGYYREALKEWRDSATRPNPKTGDEKKPKWLHDIETREYHEVVSYLTKLNVTPAELDPLMEKLTLDPELTHDEKLKITKLAEWDALSILIFHKEASFRDIYLKLEEIGASERGLRVYGIKRPLL